MIIQRSGYLPRLPLLLPRHFEFVPVVSSGSHDGRDSILYDGHGHLGSIAVAVVTVVERKSLRGGSEGFSGRPDILNGQGMRDGRVVGVLGGLRIYK